MGADGSRVLLGQNALAVHGELQGRFLLVGKTVVACRSGGPSGSGLGFVCSVVRRLFDGQGVRFCRLPIAPGAFRLSPSTLSGF